MNSYDKCEMLKETIIRLYSNEGRSKSYISKLLYVPRKTLSQKINEWDLKEAEPRHHLTPSNQKFANANRELIISRLNNGCTITSIADELKVSRGYLKTIANGDEQIDAAFKQHVQQTHYDAERRRYERMETSSFDYYEKDLPNEQWKTILGYPEYEVSNMGRVRSFTKEGRKYLLKTSKNEYTRYTSVMLYHNGSKSNLSVHRLVAHMFVDGCTPTANTVNHIDGDKTNNRADNLEWVSQSDNNKHAYTVLNRTKNRKNKSDFVKVIYQNKYEFKTVAALARFLDKSETQTRRYLEEPAKHDLTIID